MKTSVLQRIRELIDYYSLSDRKFAESIGLPQTTISSLFQRGNEPNVSIIQFILNVYTVISPEWLLTGQGSMFKTDIVTDKSQIINTDIWERFEELAIKHFPNYVENLQVMSKELNMNKSRLKEILIDGAFLSYSEIINLSYSGINIEWLITGEGSMLKSEVSIPAINQEYKGAPYYNVDFIGGFDMVVNDQTTMPDYYINYEPYNKEGVMWCNVTGHSMEPEINHGDTIAIKELKDWQTYLPFGEVYGIVTTEHRTIKRVSKSDKEGFMRLIPTNKNPEFAAQDIPLTIVMKVFQVLGSVKRFS